MALHFFFVFLLFVVYRIALRLPNECDEILIGN